MQTNALAHCSRCMTTRSYGEHCSQCTGPQASWGVAPMHGTPLPPLQCRRELPKATCPAVALNLPGLRTRPGLLQNQQPSLEEPSAPQEAKPVSPRHAGLSFNYLPLRRARLLHYLPLMRTISGACMILLISLTSFIISIFSPRRSACWATASSPAATMRPRRCPSHLALSPQPL